MKHCVLSSTEMSKRVGCSSCGHHGYGNNYDHQSLNVSKVYNANANGYVKNIGDQQVVVLVVKDDIGPCCTDKFAYIQPGHIPPKPCKFRCCSYGYGGRY